MTGGTRTPQQLLAELGSALEGAAKDPIARRRGVRRRATRLLGTIVVVAGLVVSTAAATTSIFASSPPLPRLSAQAVILGSGSVGRTAWEALVSHCEGRSGGVSLLLRSAGGGAGTACGALVGPPMALYDPDSTGALVFGAVPAGTTVVELALGAGRLRAAPVAADPAGLSAARLPVGTELFVARIASDRVVTAATAFAASGRLLLACQVARCTTP
jgi:hypothetical protein